MGDRALQSMTSAEKNSAFGMVSLVSNTTGSNNTALGTSALQSNTTASNNTAVGFEAGYTQTTGHTNTNVGVKAGYGTTTGIDNTYIGPYAGIYMTTGSKNVIIGRHSGNFGGLDIRTSSNNIVLSDGDGNPRLWIEDDGDVRWNGVSSGTPGYGNTVEGIGMECRNGAMFLSRSNGTSLWLNNNTDSITTSFSRSGSQVGSISVNTGSTSYNTSSDHRLKENVDYTWDATTRLKQLKPARFNFIADPDTTVDGFLAHEAQAVVPEAVTGTHNEVDDDGNAVMQGIDQSKLVPLLVKTIQELEARITALEGA